MFRRFRSGRGRRDRSTRPAYSFRRKPLFELLEDRRLLAVFTVTSNLDTVNAADGLLTLREAITAANVDTTFDTINFAASLSNQTIQLSSLGELKITSTMRIDGSSLFVPVTVKAFDNSGAAGDGTRIFNVNDNAAAEAFVELKGMKLTGGDLSNTADGGAVYSLENLAITSCTITGNTSGRRGGGVYAKGNTYIYISTISSNTALEDGGGAAFGGSGATPNFTITKSTVTKNTATEDGGGVWAKQGSFTLSQSTVSENSAGGLGAGLYVEGGGGYIDRSTITSNNAGAVGGGIVLRTVNGTVKNSTISNNTAGSRGGGMDIVVGTTSITNTTITGNKAIPGGGGGVFAVGTVATISGSTISNNEANFGAGLYFNTGSAPISTTTISGNIAGAHGGGVWARGGAVINFDRSTISGNSANINGGGLYTTGSSTGIVNSTVSGNSAKFFGGGIWAQVPMDRSLNFLYSTITKNTSDSDATGVGSGGGLYLRPGNGVIDLKNTIIAGNNDFTNIAPDVDNTTAGGNPTLTTAFSLIGNNKNSGLAAGNPTGTGSRIGTAAAPINPLLGALQNNGGPTKTHSLLPGSIAVNNGNPAAVAGAGGVPAVDQRGTGFSRVADGRLDIGAFEVVSPPT